METFSALPAFVRGIHWSPVNSPHKSQWRGAFIFSLICAWINGWINNRDAGDLVIWNAIVLIMTWLCARMDYLMTETWCDFRENARQCQVRYIAVAWWSGALQPMCWLRLSVSDGVILSSGHITQKWRRYYVKTTSLWRYYVTMTSFWRNNDVIITSCVQGVRNLLAESKPLANP